MSNHEYETDSLIKKQIKEQSKKLDGNGRKIVLLSNNGTHRAIRRYLKGKLPAERVIAELVVAQYPNSSSVQKFLQTAMLVQFACRQFGIHCSNYIELNSNLRYVKESLAEVAKVVLTDPSHINFKKWEEVLGDVHSFRYDYMMRFVQYGLNPQNIQHYTDYEYSEPSIMLNWIIRREKYKKLTAFLIVQKHKNGYFTNMKNLSNLICSFMVGE